MRVRGHHRPMQPSVTDSDRREPDTPEPSGAAVSFKKKKFFSFLFFFWVAGYRICEVAWVDAEFKKIMLQSFILYQVINYMYYESNLFFFFLIFNG